MLFCNQQGFSTRKMLVNLTRHRLNAEVLPKADTVKTAILRMGVTYGMSLENPKPGDINSVIVVTFQVRIKFKL